MKKKKTLYTEIAYLLGLLILAFGTALMERADFGMSMVVAPAYLVYLKLSETVTWFTFGMAEYCLQALLLIAICIVFRRAKLKYLFSFVTAVLYGLILDLTILLVGLIPGEGMAFRILLFALGVLFGSIGVSLLFRTYFAPEAYELLVKEIADGFGFNINKTKTIYDLCSCLIAIILSFAFFGLWHFEGVKLGTVITAMVNGFLIGRVTRITNHFFCDGDLLPWRKWFT